MIPDSHWAVLRELCLRLEGQDVCWALTGSTSLTLQGVPVQVHDVDVQTDQAGAYAIESCLSDYVVKPAAFSATEQIRSHFGTLVIGGVQVEVMGDIEKRLPSGGWEPAPDLASLRRFVEVEGLRLPVLPLEYEYRAYLMLGRVEKATIIKRTLEERDGPTQPEGQ